MRARGSRRACALVLLAFTAATAASLLLLAWRWSLSSPPLLEPTPSHVGDANYDEADARTLAHFIYEVYLRQCLEYRRPKKAFFNKGPKVCALGSSTNATHCINSEEQPVTAADLDRGGEQLRDLSAALKGQHVDWATDDESGSLRDALDRLGERDGRRSLQPLVPSTHPSSLIGQIFLGALLLLSVGVALCEVFRDRLREKRSPPTITNAFSNAAVDLRRCSLADLTVSRHARRESVQLANAAVAAATQQAAADDSQAEQHAHAVLRRHRLITAMSFDSGLGTSVAVQPPRPSYRILGHRPPPLQRRSSFPVPLASGSSGEQSFNTGSKLSRRSSVEQSEEESSPDLRRRVRIIRRH